MLVEDENKNPLGGVAVTFFLPSEGPSGFFPNGSRVLTVFSDEKGLAATRPIRFNDGVGLMRIRVSAALFSQTANALITETNVSSAAATRSELVPGAGKMKVARPGTSHKRLIILLVAAGAAAGLGYYFATREGHAHRDDLRRHTEHRWTTMNRAGILRAAFCGPSAALFLGSRCMCPYSGTCGTRASISCGRC